MNAPLPRRSGDLIVMFAGQFLPEVYGGAEKQCYRQSVELARRGRRVAVVTSRQLSETKGREVDSGIEIYRVKTTHDPQLLGKYAVSGFWWMIYALWWVFRRRRRIAVIHAHQLKFPAFVASVAGTLFGIPVVTKAGNAGTQSDLERIGLKKIWGPLLKKTILKRTSAFVAISNQIAGELSAAGVEGARVRRISNGISIVCSKEEIAARVEERWNGGIYFFLGRLEPVKRVDVLIRAFAGAVPGARLVIAGSGAEEDMLEKLATSFGHAKIEFVGYQSETAHLLQKARYLVLASEAEGMSNALLEAMAMGIVPVSTPVSGSTDLIQDGASGFLADGYAQEDMEEVLKRAQQQSIEDYRTMSMAALDSVSRQSGLEAVVDRYVALYDELTSRS